MTPDYPIKALAQAWSLANRAQSVEASHVRLSIEARILEVLRVPSQGEAAWAFCTLMHEISLQGELVGIDRMFANSRSASTREELGKPNTVSNGPRDASSDSAVLSAKANRVKVGTASNQSGTESKPYTGSTITDLEKLVTEAEAK